MPGTRAYEFVVGPETPTLPSASDPVADADQVSKGYADKNYHRSVADVAAVKAIAAASRQDAMVLWVDSLLSLFYFDSASVLAGNDITVITPTAGSGRWLLMPAGASVVTGTRAAPISVPIAGLTGALAPKGAQEEIIFVQGSAGAVTITNNPRIAAGTRVGQKLQLIGRSDTNLLTIPNGQGVAQNGNLILGEGSMISYVWDGVNYVEESRNDL